MSLTHHLEELTQREARSGRYSWPSEVMHEALRLLQEQKELHRDRTAELHLSIHPAREQTKRGQDQDGHEAFRELRAGSP